MDALYATHDNIRGHRVGTMSMGKNCWGSIISISNKQKVNTKILTEAGIIRADNTMPQMICARYILESQGYSVDRNILYQENMSAMLPVKNGKKF